MCCYRRSRYRCFLLNYYRNSELAYIVSIYIIWREIKGQVLLTCRSKVRRTYITDRSFYFLILKNIFSLPTFIIPTYHRRIIIIGDSRCNRRKRSHLRTYFTYRPNLANSCGIFVHIRSNRIGRYCYRRCLVERNMITNYRCGSINSRCVCIFYTTSRILTRSTSISFQVQRLRSTNLICQRQPPHDLTLRSICRSRQCDHLLFTGSGKRYRVAIISLRLRSIEELNGICSILFTVVVKSNQLGISIPYLVGKGRIGLRKLDMRYIGVIYCKLSCCCLTSFHRAHCNRTCASSQIRFLRDTYLTKILIKCTSTIESQFLSAWIICHINLLVGSIRFATR